jgi:hypothetical protein
VVRERLGKLPARASLVLNAKPLNDPSPSLALNARRRSKWL